MIDLPAPANHPLEKTFDVPAIIELESVSPSGFNLFRVRQGGAIKLTGRMETTITLEPPPDETDKVFRIRSTNAINLGGAIGNFLTDEIHDKTINVPATTPSAYEYVSKIGTEVMIYSKTRRSNNSETIQVGQECFVTNRLFVFLP